MKDFLIANTRQNDLLMFSDLAGAGPYAEPTEVPFSTLLPAFMTSELKTASRSASCCSCPSSSSTW